MSRPAALHTDILIIGGGSAGCVLASRLSETSEVDVTLVEAGPDVSPGHVPADMRDLFPRSYANPAYFWQDVRARTGVDSALQPYSQARVLGGGSSVMGMWAVRGAQGDYDGWAAAGAPGWSYCELLPYFRKLETDLDFASSVHGTDGPTSISRVPVDYWPPFIRTLAEAAQRRGLAMRADLNGTDDDGVFPLPLSNDRRQRSSTAVAYLTSAVRARRNLRILTGAKAQTLILAGNRAIGARVVAASGESLTIAGKNTVIAAGAIHSPALLLRSGIGDPAILEEIGVEPRLALTHVGRGLRNHAFVHLGAVIRHGSRQSPAVRSYAMACARMSSGLGAEHGDLLLSFIARSGMHRRGNRIGMVGICLLDPKAVGEVVIGRDGSPQVNFRLFSDARDAARLLYGARFARTLLEELVAKNVASDLAVLPRVLPLRLLNSPGIGSAIVSDAIAATVALPRPLRRAMLSIGAPGIRFLQTLRNEREFAAAIAASAAPMFHPTGTCAIGKVVDPGLRIYGADGVFIADASVMPAIPRANTNIPTIMVAEKAADLIKKALR